MKALCAALGRARLNQSEVLRLAPDTRRPRVTELIARSARPKVIAISPHAPENIRHIVRMDAGLLGSHYQKPNWSPQLLYPSGPGLSP
ncbi:unnamed protein product [Boreogadus saida]